MRIAILASGNADKALHIYNFFKEGNRVEIDCLITDNPQSAAVAKFGAEGIPAFVIDTAEWADGSRLTELLESRNAEIIVVDELESPMPESVMEKFGSVMLYPTGTAEAPNEVVALYNKLTAKQSEDTANPAKAERRHGGALTPDEEWADALKVDYSEEEAAQRAAKQEEIDRENKAKAEKIQKAAQETYERLNPKNLPPMPDTYLVWSVLATVFCCLIPGIIAIIYSSAVSSKYYARDLEGAKRASKRAQIWIIVSVVTAIIWGSLYIPLMLLAI